MPSDCPTNRELVQAVAVKLNELHSLMRAIRDARGTGTKELSQKLQVAFKEKDRCVEQWTLHNREHGC